MTCNNYNWKSQIKYHRYRICY